MYTLLVPMQRNYQVGEDYCEEYSAKVVEAAESTLRGRKSEAVPILLRICSSVDSDRITDVSLLSRNAQLRTKSVLALQMLGESPSRCRADAFPVPPNPRMPRHP